MRGPARHMRHTSARTALELPARSLRVTGPEFAFSAGNLDWSAMDTDIAQANRTWWDGDAERYHHSHAPYLSSFYWCPEMLHEADAQLLGDVSGATVLELGGGSAPCASWLAGQGADFVIAFDISMGMLTRADRDAGVGLVQADAQALPYRSDSFDVVFSAFGALPFVPDVDAVLRDVARVMRPGGRLVFSVNHPMRWVFADDPGVAGLTAMIPYFERSYIETDDAGDVVYAEYHRTFGDWVRAINGAGLKLVDVLEPAWPDGLEETWGQWSPLRGRIFPGTAIFLTELP